MFGLNSDVEVMVGDVGAKADVGVQLYGQDGKLKPQFGASAMAEATAAELEDSVGASLGAEIDIGGMADTVCDKAVSAWNDVKKGWETVTSCF